MLVNGQQCDTVSLLDRGLQYGDGLFETIAVIGHEMPLWQRHYARLSSGCKRLAIEVPQEQQIRDEIQQEIFHHGEQSGRCVVKLIVTRGAAGNGYFPAEGDTQRIVILRQSAGFDHHDREHGIDIHLCETCLASGSPHAGIKHLNRLEQVLAAREAESNNCREAVVCDSEGFVVEGVMSNIFWITGSEMFTPLLDGSGVAGVMREEVIAQAAVLGISCREVRVTPGELSGANAIFLTNAVNGIVPVRRLAGREYSLDAISHDLLETINRKLMKHEA
ncbi:aminodeoxychorismate lyase [Solemya velum gill symbiont]|uniref:Aminodeoxychorismate lyase n=1 Tax=Solemya velum gill symbiont TaxID=2340 RepID=A0A0B0HAK6_SOVGS|nr:aminodeoxychorismate lyase [Solemya velum gill symbiont]KHF26130.1 aminodeoxychorismate lyase [Solemya velum gill symbiont]